MILYYSGSGSGCSLNQLGESQSPHSAPAAGTAPSRQYYITLYYIILYYIILYYIILYYVMLYYII